MVSRSQNGSKSSVIVRCSGMRLVRLPRRVIPGIVHQSEVETGRLFVPLIFSMPIAKDEVPALLVEIVVMLAWGSAPFAGTRCRPRVPLGVSISARSDDLRFIPKRVHQTVILLHDGSPGGIREPSHALVQYKLADNYCRRTDDRRGIRCLLRGLGGWANI